MRRFLMTACLFVLPSATWAGDFAVGDLVFWKEDTRASDGKQEISIATFAFPSPVRDVQKDFLFLGRGWIHKDDALSVDEALEYFTTKIKENPEQAAYLNNRGRVWVVKGDYTKAVADFTQAAKVDPKDSVAHVNLGAAEQERGNHETAIPHFTAALKINPDHATAYYNRGRANQYSDNFEAAAKDYAAAIRVDPSYLPAYNNAAWLAATCPDEKYRNPQQALALATQAAQMTQGKVWEVLDTLAAAQASAGEYEAAVKTSEQALTLGSDAAVHGGVRDRMTLYQAGKPYYMPAD
jgi:tetratricopeptide (TPR) repeat protein